MNLRHTLRTLLLVAAALFLCSCAVPLGPGFFTEKELLEVRFVPGAPPHLEIRASFTLNNTGNAPLDALDLSLPDEKEFGRSNLRITVDGAAASPQPPAADSPSSATARIAFAAPWPEKSKHTLVVSYDLDASAAAASHFGLSADSFFLPAQDWFPLLRAPKGLFAEGDKPPKRFDFSVFVPPDFLVHAAGRPYGKKRRSTETEYPFRIAPEDFSPFVVAGRYHEQKFSDSNGSVLFWTFNPLASEQVTRAGAFISLADHVYQSAFGPRSKRHNPIWLVETDGYPCIDMNFPRAPIPSTTEAPETVLLCSPTKLGIGTDQLESIDAVYSLAATWFEYVAAPQPGADLPLLQGLAEYARSISELNRGHLDFRVAAISTHIAGVNNGFKSSKAALFLFALEDEIGTTALQKALRRMIQNLRGSTYGETDLRVTCEAESGKNLGEFFRLWLNQPGIPADFRARYTRH